MRMGQGVRTGLGHGGITCVLQTQFSSFYSKEATVQLQIKPIQVYLIIWILQLFHEKQFRLFFIDTFIT